MHNKMNRYDNNTFNTTQYICFFYKDFQKYCEEKLKPYDLTNGLYLYLIFIYRNQGSNLNEISKALNLDKALTTRSIKKLIENNYVEKTIDKTDNRAFNVHATEKCNEAMAEIKNLFSEWEKIILKDFTKHESDTFKTLFNKAYDNIEY